MEVIIKQSELLDVLQKVTGPTTTKQNFPILTSVLIETYEDQLKLTTTDLDNTIISFSKANIIKPGKVVVSFKKLISIIRELPTQEITLELVKNNLSVKCENIEFKVSILDSEEFPKVEHIKKTALIKIDPQELIYIIKLSSFCVGYEDTNYVLNGILFEIYENQINAVSTDGKRLAFIKRNLPQSQSELKSKLQFILPIKAVNEIQKLIKDKEEEIYFFVEKNKIGFDFKNTQIITRPIEGEFPNYDQYIPKPYPNKLIINRRDFLSAFKRAALLSTPDYQSVKLELKKDEVIISKSTPQWGEVRENVPCQYEGKSFQIGFNPNYLIDVLRNLEEEYVNFEFFDIDKPAVLRKDDYVYLVLPMKI